MFRLVRSCLTLAIILMCFVTSCAQSTVTNELIEQINVAKAKAQNLVEEAERKRVKAREKSESVDRNEPSKLIEEAAKLYRQASDALYEASDKAQQMAKAERPAWYGEYFSLQAKLIRNLAQLAAGAHEELLVRISGAPSESQLKSWKENIDRITKKNLELRRQITAIESRQGGVLVR